MHGIEISSHLDLDTAMVPFSGGGNGSESQRQQGDSALLLSLLRAVSLESSHFLRSGLSSSLSRRGRGFELPWQHSLPGSSLFVGEPTGLEMVSEIVPPSGLPESNRADEGLNDSQLPRLVILAAARGMLIPERTASLEGHELDGEGVNRASSPDTNFSRFPTPLADDLRDYSSAQSIASSESPVPLEVEDSSTSHNSGPSLVIERASALTQGSVSTSAVFSGLETGGSVPVRGTEGLSGDFLHQSTVELVIPSPLRPRSVSVGDSSRGAEASSTASLMPFSGMGQTSIFRRTSLPMGVVRAESASSALVGSSVIIEGGLGSARGQSRSRSFSEAVLSSGSGERRDFSASLGSRRVASSPPLPPPAPAAATVTGSFDTAKIDAFLATAQGKVVFPEQSGQAQKISQSLKTASDAEIAVTTKEIKLVKASADKAADAAAMVALAKAGLERNIPQPLMPMFSTAITADAPPPKLHFAGGQSTPDLNIEMMKKILTDLVQGGKVDKVVLANDAAQRAFDAVKAGQAYTEAQLSKIQEYSPGTALSR